MCNGNCSWRMAVQGTLEATGRSRRKGTFFRWLRAPQKSPQRSLRAHLGLETPGRPPPGRRLVAGDGHDVFFFSKNQGTHCHPSHPPSIHPSKWQRVCAGRVGEAGVVTETGVGGGSSGTWNLEPGIYLEPESAQEQSDSWRLCLSRSILFAVLECDCTMAFVSCGVQCCIEANF